MCPDLRFDTRPPAIALMGPTASGKTSLAMDWATRFGLSLISVDSALVYRGMNIGSAKPDAAMLARVPHRLIDIRDPHERYSAAEFAEDARREMRAIAEAGGVPLLVGGTGLYFRALLRGLAEMPAADPAFRAVLAQRAQKLGWAALHRELAEVDPQAAARIQPADAQRIQRALEVHQLSGRSISEWQRASHSRAPCPWRVLKLALLPRDRAGLHARIAKRFDAMVEAGFVDEVRVLRADPRFDADSPAMRAVGYRQALEHLDTGSSPAQFRERAIAATRQLAKRQITWLRAEWDARALDPQVDGAEATQAVAAFLGRPSPNG
ncbi:MAG TPA: tRNA (adenosine(37)-N6)-dimethylallyltransferase MiaA [Chiayiivirga sp.]|nr:tRNA (adenosine(37)-N6)-dimethylallyltransferase MiaA [Chiayiivirga sp.]